MCIPRDQNSGLQGPLIRWYTAFYGIKAGDQFVVRMGSCDGSYARSVHERETAAGNSLSETTTGDGTLSLSTTTTEFMPIPNGGGGGFVLISLGNA